MKQPLILVIEDEAPLRRFLVLSLVSQGYQVDSTSTAAEGLSLAREFNPDVILLDLGLPDQDGQEVLQQLKAWFTRPVLVISARSQEREKVQALDHGADDYLTKPFGAAELLARIRVALRRASAVPGELAVLQLGSLHLDPDRHEVSVDGQPVKLTPLEFKLLLALARRAGKVVTHAQLLNEVWGPNGEGQTHYVRIYMGTLRRKLEPDSTHPRFLLTEPGVGYRLDVDAEGR
jgi:two-component system KDP operon response regulator KdpE